MQVLFMLVPDKVEGWKGMRGKGVGRGREGWDPSYISANYSQ